MFSGALHPYQQDAFDLTTRRLSSLIAYEMGLGKTPTSLAVIESLMEDGTIREPGLVIALSSLKYQWAAQIRKFTDSTPLVIDGTPAQRKAQYETALNWRDSGVDYIVMNYEAVVKDFDLVKELPRGFLLMDECTAIKSSRSKRHKAVKALSKDVDVKVGLSGTPMTNGKPDEIYHQFAVIDPSLLGGYMDFDRRYIIRNQMGWITGYRNLPDLHRRLMSAMPTKKQSDPDVAPYLPKTIYREPMLVPLDRASRAVYGRIKGDLLDDLREAASLLGEAFSLGQTFGGAGSDQGGPADELRGKIASKVTALRMLCSHPDLLKASAQKFGEMSGSGSQYLYDLAEEGVFNKLAKAPKLEALASYVDDFLEVNEKNKVVIFSTFVDTLDLIQKRLSKHGSVTYSGKMNAAQKESQKIKFQTDPNTRIFISSDAGGFGVDLPEANLLINYDLPWASGTAAQRNGRIRRASSTWGTVVIQNLLIEDSMEVRQFEQLQEKNRIEAAVLEGTGFDKSGGVTLSVASLRRFLTESSL